MQAMGLVAGYRNLAGRHAVSPVLLPLRNLRGTLVRRHGQTNLESGYTAFHPRLQPRGLLAVPSSLRYSAVAEMRRWVELFLSPVGGIDNAGHMLVVSPT